MFKCVKCNKEFKYKSKLKEHKNRKMPCNSPIIDYKCEFCNVKFSRLFSKIKDEKTKKHINNYNKWFFRK